MTLHGFTNEVFYTIPTFTTLELTPSMACKACKKVLASSKSVIYMVKRK